LNFIDIYNDLANLEDPLTVQPKKKVKFLFISSDKFPPFRVDVAILFGKKMVERGHIIDWLLQSDENLQRSYQTEWSGSKIWVGPTDNGTSRVNRLRKHFYSIFHDFKLFGMSKMSKYSFILIKDKFISAIMAIVASKIYKTKFIFWLSYPFPEHYVYEFQEGTARYPLIYWLRGHFLKIILYRIILPFSDHIFTQSEQMKRDIAAKGISKEKMTPVPMGVSIQEIPYFEYNTQQNKPDREKKVLYLGTLVKVRKIDFLIRIFGKLLRKMNNVKLFLVGSGEDPSDEKIIKEEAQRLGIEHSVFITGFLPQQEAWQYAKTADVCVSPFYPTPILNSTSPTKLIEYMAMGKAVVANDHPEQSTVISESKGGICVPYEENAFAEAIHYLLIHPDDTKKMGTMGRKYVEEYRSYERIADLVEKTLLQVCDII